MTRRLAFAAALIACVGAGVFPAAADDAEDCAKSSGAAAIAACDSVIGSRRFSGKELADIFYYRGVEWAQLGETDKAIADFEQSSNIDPTSTAALLALAQGHLAKGDFERAISIYTEAIVLDKEEPNGFYYRAGAYLEHGEFDKAIEDFSTAISLDPDDAAFYNARGVVSAAAGDLDLAIDDYDFAIARQPDFGLAFANRGDARLALGELDGAIEDYRQAIAAAPEDAITIYKLGNAHRSKGDVLPALDSYNRLIELLPQESDAYYERGTTLMLGHDPNAAIADFDAAIRLDPASAPAFQARGLAHQANSDMDSAIADYSEAIRLDPENAERYVTRAWASHLAGRDRLALVDADQAVALNPGLVSVHSTRAAILSALGDHDAAQTEKEAAGEAGTALAAARESEKSQAEARTAQRRQARLDAEKAFLEVYDASHPYIYPVQRAAVALGFAFSDTDVRDFGDELAGSARQALAGLQRSNRLRGTGYLDEKTFLMLLDQPVDIGKFEVERPWNVEGEAIGDWFFSADTEWCAIWVKPKAIAGRLAPDFGKLPLFVINRLREAGGNALSQAYADSDLFAETADVVVRTDKDHKTEKNGGDFGPARSCGNNGCFASDEVLKAVRAAGGFDVVGQSAFGGELAISYSAAGFTKAFNRLDRECGHGRLGSWLR